jgi:hypothetical protein
VLLLPSLSADREQAASKLRRVEEAASRLKHGKVVGLDDSVHDVPLQHPELVADQIAEFLRDVETGEASEFGAAARGSDGGPE